MKKWLLILIAAGTLLITACSGEEKADGDKGEAIAEETNSESEDKEVSSEKELVPAAALHNVHEIVKEKGKYDIDKLNKDQNLMKQLVADLEQLPEGLTGEEAYNLVIPLVAADIQKEAEQFESVDPVIKFDSSEPGSNIELPESETVNVVILLDASGSMAAQVSGGQKMKLAKEAINSYASDLPKGSNVLLRVYGHKGTGSDADKALSCKSHEVVYPLGAYDESKFAASLNQFEPAGWTPLAGAIEEAKKDLAEQQGENIQNVIYVVSDGVETCDGDPVAAAKALHSSGIVAEVNIIGFDVDNEGQNQLMEVAKAGGGIYKSVYAESDLRDYLQKEHSRLYWEWLAWGNDRYFNVLEQSNDIYFEMLGLNNDIYFKSLSEKNLMSTIKYELKNLGKFKDDEAADRFSELAAIRHETVDLYFDQEEERKNKIRIELKEKYEKLIKDKKKENASR